MTHDMPPREPQEPAEFVYDTETGEMLGERQGPSCFAPDVDWSKPPEDPRAHYAVRVVNIPPTEIACKCGQVFTGDDPLGQQKAHMDALNENQE